MWTVADRLAVRSLDNATGWGRAAELVKRAGALQIERGWPLIFDGEFFWTSAGERTMARIDRVAGDVTNYVIPKAAIPPVDDVSDTTHIWTVGFFVPDEGGFPLDGASRLTP